MSHPDPRQRIAGSVLIWPPAAARHSRIARGQAGFATGGALCVVIAFLALWPYFSYGSVRAIGARFMHAVFVHPIVSFMHDEFRQESGAPIIQVDESAATKFKTEFCSVPIRWRKNVAVFNPSPHKGFVASWDFAHIGGMNINTGSWPDKAALGDFMHWFKSKSADAIGWNYNSEDVVAEISGRRSPAILKCRDDFPRNWLFIFPTRDLQSQCFQKDTGSILGFD